uniref:Uncharacterized protein n=1 Tax=Calcidiscus leptoporus TaxID=127549 RepID=A0A7S0NY18_9EUKA
MPPPEVAVFPPLLMPATALPAAPTQLSAALPLPPPASIGPSRLEITREHTRAHESTREHTKGTREHARAHGRAHDEEGGQRRICREEASDHSPKLQYASLLLHTCAPSELPNSYQLLPTTRSS